MEHKPLTLWKKHGTWMDFMLTYNFHEFAMNFHPIFLSLGGFTFSSPWRTFYQVIFLFWHKTDIHGWSADGRARSHNLKSVHGNIGKKITFFNLIILNNQTQGSM